jgi:hypothetical protein
MGGDVLDASGGVKVPRAPVGDGRGFGQEMAGRAGQVQSTRLE